MQSVRIENSTAMEGNCEVSLRFSSWQLPGMYLYVKRDWSSSEPNRPSRKICNLREVSLRHVAKACETVDLLEVFFSVNLFTYVAF